MSAWRPSSSTSCSEQRPLLNTGDTNTDGEAPSKSRRPCSGLHPLRAHPSAARSVVAWGCRMCDVMSMRARGPCRQDGAWSQTWQQQPRVWFAHVNSDWLRHPSNDLDGLLCSDNTPAHPYRCVALRWLARRPDEFSNRVNLIEEYFHFTVSSTYGEYHRLVNGYRVRKRVCSQCSGRWAHGTVQTPDSDVGNEH